MKAANVFLHRTLKAGNLLANLFNDLRKRLLHAGRELLVVGKRFAGDRDNKGKRAGPVNGLRVSEQARWCEMMSKRVASSPTGHEVPALPTSGTSLVASINEHDEIGSADR